VAQLGVVASGGNGLLRSVCGHCVDSDDDLGEVEQLSVVVARLKYLLL
jgi:hypothetical protein